MRRPSLTPKVVRGLFTISAGADALLDDFTYDGTDGQAELHKGCRYLAHLILWYRSNHPEFDVFYQTPGEPTEEDCPDETV